MKKILVALLILLAGGLAFATPAKIQNTKNYCASATSCAISPVSSVTANDTLIIQVDANNNTTLSSITDNLNSVVACAAYSGTNNPGIGIYYIQAASGGSHTVTVTMSATSNLTLFISEWSGTGACDTVSAIAAHANTSITTASISPAASDLVIFGVSQAGTGLTYSAFTNSFVQQDSYNTNGPTATWASVVTGSSISGGVTSSSANSSASVVAAFLPLSGCTHSGITSAGAISIPNGSSGTYRLTNGTLGTPDCSTKSYLHTDGSIGVN